MRSEEFHKLVKPFTERFGRFSAVALEIERDLAKTYLDVLEFTGVEEITMTKCLKAMTKAQELGCILTELSDMRSFTGDADKIRNQMVSSESAI